VTSYDSVKEIRRQVMWNRLIAVVEEQAETLIRASFSPTVREAGDLSAGIFDTKGRMLAQAVTGTPGHVNSMATAVTHFLRRYPIATIRPGDCFVTNDPWLTAGHLHDVTVVTPAFKAGVAVGLFAATIHVIDVGGRGMGTDARQVFEEGLYIPIMYLARQGCLNEDLMALVRANTREPIQVEGDIFSCMAAGDEGARRLIEMMLEFEIPDLDELAEFIIGNSRTAMLKRLSGLPRGTYRHSMTIDGYDEPITVSAALTIHEAGVHVDYDGSSPESRFGINVVLNYTAAYTTFGIKCCVAPEIPNNWGSMSTITVSAPEGTIVNARFPAPVSARHVVGHMTPDVAIGCLHQAFEEGLPAEGSMMWNPMLRGTRGFANEARSWEIYTFHSGGMGARPDKDGHSATAFPSGVRTVPLEASEAVAPILYWRKELRPDSGGAGRARGGLGQVIEIGSANGESFGVQAMFDRIDHPARGRDGGGNGVAGRITTAKQRPFRSKGLQSIESDDVLRLELPGGGGFGDPRERKVELVMKDLALGLISRAAARDLYGVIVGEDGSLDLKATRVAREGLNPAQALIG
jgi:N-methylhydantoinase B